MEDSRQVSAVMKWSPSAQVEGRDVHADNLFCSNDNPPLH